MVSTAEESSAEVEMAPVLWGLVGAVAEARERAGQEVGADGDFEGWEALPDSVEWEDADAEHRVE